MNRIKLLRNELHITQEELGRKTNADKGTVSRWEREERQFDTATIHILCDTFKCTSDYLLGRSSFRNPVVTEEQASLITTYEALPPAIRRAVDGLMEPYRSVAEEKKASLYTGTSKGTGRIETLTAIDIKGQPE